jgi:integrase
VRKHVERPLSTSTDVSGWRPCREFSHNGHQQHDEEERMMADDGPDTVKANRKRHRNDGLRKLCDCSRRQWATCEHPWHFNYKWNGVGYRFSLDKQIGHRLKGKTDAKNEAENIRIAIRNGAFQQGPVLVSTPTTAEAVTFEVFAKLYKERATPKKARDRGAWERDIQYHLNHVVDFQLNGVRFGDKPIGAITEDDLEAFMNDRRAKGRSASNRNQYVQLFSSMFRWAAKKKYISSNPIGTDSEIRREKPARRSRRLEADEEARLLAVAAARLQRLIIGALETACRRGELLKLQWKDVNLDRREIVIRAENAKDNETRHLPISSRLHAVLEMGKTDPMGKDFEPDAYVFGEATGGRLKTVKRAWATALLKANGHKPTWEQGGRLSADCRAQLRAIDLHFHDLRHEAASRLLEGRWPLHHVQQMLGHASIDTTNTYLNVTRLGLQESMRKLDDTRGHGADTAPRKQLTTAENQPPSDGNALVN